MSDDVELFLEHHGVKGMKWGVRRNDKIQKHLDSIGRVRDGGSTAMDRHVARSRAVYTKKDAADYLRRGHAQQQKVKEGNGKVLDAIGKASGFTITNLNYHQDAPAPKLNDTERAAQIHDQRVKTAKVVLGATAAIGVAALVVDMDQHPDSYIKAAEFAGKYAGKAARVATDAARGARVIFQKDMIVYKPGEGPRPPMRGLALGR